MKAIDRIRQIVLFFDYCAAALWPNRFTKIKDCSKLPSFSLIVKTEIDAHQAKVKSVTASKQPDSKVKAIE